jgi:hypothetical protein
MASFSSSGICFLSNDTRTRFDTAFHHFASVARGGSELVTGSNDGSINAAFSDNSLRPGSGLITTPWYSDGKRKVTARSSPEAGIELSATTAGCDTETGSMQEAGRAGTIWLAIEVSE